MIRGSTYSALMHGAILLVILFGLPSLTFLLPLLKKQEVPIRVVVMSEQDAEELAKSPQEKPKPDSKADTKSPTEEKQVSKSDTSPPPEKTSKTDSESAAEKKLPSKTVDPPTPPSPKQTSETEESEDTQAKIPPKARETERLRGAVSVVKEADPKSDSRDDKTTTREPAKKEKAIPAQGTAEDDRSSLTQKSRPSEPAVPTPPSAPSPAIEAASRPPPAGAGVPPVTMVFRPGTGTVPQTSKGASPDLRGDISPPQADGMIRDEKRPTPPTGQTPQPAETGTPSDPVASAPKSSTQEALTAALPAVPGGDVKVAPPVSKDSLSQREAVANVIKELAEKVPRLKSLRDALAQPSPSTKSNPAIEQSAKRMAELAAEGYAHSQFTLAEMYLTGDGMPKDEKKAVELLNRAAISGFLPAQLTLGMLAAEGRATERNLAEAHTWLGIAADQGHKAAKEALPKLEKLMASKDAVEARKRSAQLHQILVMIHGGDLSKASKTELSERLRVAAALGDVESVHVLLAQGGDADGPDQDGRTAVIEASWRGYPQIVKSLIDNGAKLTASDNTGKNAIMWAAINGHGDVIKQLVAAGSPVDERDNEGITALMRAAWNGHAEAVRALLAANADRSLRDKKGRTAHDFAGLAGNKTIQQILAQR